MSILVTGGTGHVGSEVVKELLKRGVEVRVLARDAKKTADLPAGAEMAIADMLDPVALESAMKGIDKLFLLNAGVPDELTQALITYGVAKRSGIRHVTYLSVFKVEQFRDVPHFASKLAVESMLRAMDMPHTILRPAYYMQNDATFKDALTSGLYPSPIGTAGIASADIRDLAEAAAITLTEDGHEGATYDIVSPTPISGPSNAVLWSKLLNRPVEYAGHDFDKWESAMRGKMPTWSAFDLRMMFERYYERGFASTQPEVDRLATLLGHKPRSYEAFAEETVATWKQ